MLAACGGAYSVFWASSVGCSRLDQDRTLFIEAVTTRDIKVDGRVHYLEVIAGPEIGRRIVLGPDGGVIGRAPPADFVLAGTQVSRNHCRLTVQGEHLLVSDLGSTNGTYVDGVRQAAPVRLAVGAVLQVGEYFLKHEWRTQTEVREAQQLDRDLERASSYVSAMLPPPIRSGPITAEWVYQPCAKLGGDAFGYGELSGGRFAVYLIDVAGHGAGAAMHSVSVMNLLRQRAVPGADMAKPDEVLTALNAMFQMEEHDGMYFTMWYGVFDRASRRLDYASGGSHPAYLLRADRSQIAPLKTKNGLIGGMPGKVYRSDSIEVPEGTSLYLFSDGVFEIVTTGGLQWGLQDFLPLIAMPPVPGLNECQRLHQAVAAQARPGSPEDDFSMVVMTFH